MSKARNGEKSQQGRLADMSLPPEERGRRGRGKRRHKQVGGTPPAQMSHASGGKGRKKAREGEKQLRQLRASRLPGGGAGAPSAGYNSRPAQGLLYMVSLKAGSRRPDSRYRRFT